MKIFLPLLFLLSGILSGYAQCGISASAIESDDLPYQSIKVKYIHNAPSYIFAKGGDTAELWNVKHKPITLAQLPPAATVVQKRVEDYIRAYAGDQFFDDLFFDNVEIVYPEQKRYFPYLAFQRYGLKYWFTYKLKVDSLRFLPIGVGVYENNNIAITANLPKVGTYTGLKKNINYCELAKIAVRANKNLNRTRAFSF